MRFTQARRHKPSRPAPHPNPGRSAILSGWSATPTTTEVTTEARPDTDLSRSLPTESWRNELAPHLTPAENVLAGLEVDLDAQLHFRTSLLVLTDQRLWSRPAGARDWQSWPLAAAQTLKHHDHAGVGVLELHTPDGKLADWRYTLGQNPAAIRLLERFETQIEVLRTGQQPAPREEIRCPACKAPLEHEDDECPACDRELHTPPSTWTLFRLWRFARPYQGQLLAGFLLMLGATGATLVSPYLYMPLMDKVLIPFQNGAHIEPATVALYLSGLLGAALVSWSLGWAKTYILALVSERISADLRTTTYEHLLQLSLEYFGGKRTGDLMSRIGSESDRISVFLSLHALDFITDVLMIVMTAVILFSINPWLALVTLLPLPFIAWMIHLVRDRLRTGFEKIDRVWGEVTNVLADTIPGIRVVKAFAQERREAQRFREANQSNLQVNDKLNKTWSLFSP
ncbi:ABC transporter transmembrane domain-containing protein, partial [Chitinimonas sp.]|uniref:ABC transporter transmembrane domain-containing protein n=1 Tax=Chitinimonas sp. TaxID=1934313 RepID=UPI002F91FB14